MRVKKITNEIKKEIYKLQNQGVTLKSICKQLGFCESTIYRFLYPEKNIQDKEKNKKYAKEYYKLNKKELLIKDRARKEANKENISQYQKNYRLKNADKIIEYRIKNKQRQAEQSKNRYFKNREKLIKIAVKNNKIRYKNDLNYKIKHNLRGRINQALKGKNKSISTMELIGCTIEELKSHLEKQFLPGMSWENYNYRGWHVDHKKSCFEFDLLNPKEQISCFHYTNLRPLWAKDNLTRPKK